MSERFLFVRPPRPLWPFSGPSSAFWPPLAFASLAAALRDAVPDLSAAILDAPALRMGWRSLRATLRRMSPSYVGLGEEAVSCEEGLRLAALAQDAGAQTIAGGCFFGNVAPEVLRTGCIDVVVHGEGEATIVELVAALRTGKDEELTRVAGISFERDGEVITTEPRHPLDDLDRLPMPAYDLLPVDRYGRGSRNHPDFAAIELGRGCTSACSFCVLWRQMGRTSNARPAPLHRTKSPERLLEEVRILATRFGRRYLGWVDPCFNADPHVPGRLAELLLRDGLGLGQSAWVRADGLVRDAASGALGRCAAAGLNEVYIGVERPDGAGLDALGKQRNNGEVRTALRVLTRDYPEISTVGSFIYGLPGDTDATMRAIYRRSFELDLDMAFYIPLTPLPGTPYWKPELWDPTGRRFRSFDFLPTVDGDPSQARLTRALYRCVALAWSPQRFRWLFRGLLSRNARRRRITRRHALRGLRFCAAGTARALTGRGAAGALRFPPWYND